MSIVKKVTIQFRLESLSDYLKQAENSSHYILIFVE